MLNNIIIINKYFKQQPIFRTDSITKYCPFIKFWYSYEGTFPVRGMYENTGILSLLFVCTVLCKNGLLLRTYITLLTTNNKIYPLTSNITKASMCGQVFVYLTYQENRFLYGDQHVFTFISDIHELNSFSLFRSVKGRESLTLKQKRLMSINFVCI